VLSNEDKRRIYDQGGEQALKEGNGGGGGFSSPMDLFDMMFGMGGRSHRQRKGKDVVHQMSVSLEDLYNGAVRKLALQKNVLCDKCEGRGGKKGAVEKCPSCRGAGVTIRTQQIGPGMIQQIQSMCAECQGQGERINPKDRCKTCLGRKVVKERKILEVHIDKGMRDGQKVTFAGEGDQEPGLEPGDIIIVLDEKDHQTFKRNGFDLITKIELQLVESLCGFQRSIKTLDEREIVISAIPGEVIKHGAVRCVLGEGMPQYRNPFEKGRLIVQFDVIFPPSNFLPANKLAELEALLPARPPAPIITEHSEEVNMVELDPAHDRRNHTRGHAYDEDDDDEGAHRGGVQCQSH